MKKLLSFLKTNIKAVIALILVAAIAVGVVSVSNRSRSGGVSVAADEKVISARIVSGDVEQLFYGSGTLADEEYEKVELPDTVEVTGYTVRTGERVKAGDRLARVDKTSVMKAIADLQEAIDELDERIAEAADDTVPSSRFANCSARVKAVYAKAGDTVQDIMYNYGSLMVLSLDGYMACDLPTCGNQSVGDKELVIRADAAALTATVAKIDNGTMTVICSDDGVHVGEKVTVTDESGVKLGEGEMYIHVPEYVTNFTGTVENVFVAQEDTVCAGQCIISYTDTGYTGEYDRLLSLRQDYGETMKELFRTAYDGYIRSPADGIVTGIDETVDYLPLASGLSGDGAKGGVSLLGGAGQNIMLMPLGFSLPDALKAFSGEIREEVREETREEGRESEEPTAEGYSRAAIVDSIDGFTLSVRFYPGDISDVDDITSIGSGEFTESGTIVMDSYVSGVSVGSYLNVSYSSGGVYQGFTVASSKGTGGAGGIMSGGGGMSFGGGSEAAAEEEAPYSLSKKTVCSVIPPNKMTVTVSVDELDILSLREGQKALVTLDAFPGQSFEGVVTDIDPSGTNEGGTTKYSASITVDRNASMLSGMNASTRITLSEKKGVLLIPVAAICEEGGKCLVYTGYDPGNDELILPVEITTGLSDGENAEVLSGLREGDTVWYRYADSVRLSFR